VIFTEYTEKKYAVLHVKIAYLFSLYPLKQNFESKIPVSFTHSKEMTILGSVVVFFIVHVYNCVNTNQPIICLNHFVTNIKSTKSNVSKLGTLKRSVSKKMDSVKTKIGSTTEKIPKIKKPKLPKILKRKKSKTSEIPEVENPEYESAISTSPEPEEQENPK